MPILNKGKHTNFYIIKVMVMVMLVQIPIVLLNVKQPKESIVVKIGTIVVFRINVKFIGMATTAYKNYQFPDVQMHEQLFYVPKLLLYIYNTKYIYSINKLILLHLPSLQNISPILLFISNSSVNSNLRF